jgi:PhnB protein
MAREWPRCRQPKETNMSTQRKKAVTQTVSEAKAEIQPAKAETLGGVVAYLMVDGAVKAAEFYQRAFGAREVYRQPVDDSGRTMHIHLHLNGSSLMLGDPHPEHCCGRDKPEGFHMMLPVQDIDASWERAIDAGCESVMPVQLMFWGDRYGQCRDPFGIMWAMNQPVETPSPKLW